MNRTGRKRRRDNIEHIDQPRRPKKRTKIVIDLTSDDGEDSDVEDVTDVWEERKRIEKLESQNKEDENTENEGIRKNQNDDSCPICLDKVKDRGILDCCDHRFCFKCIRKWAKSSNVCPVCRRRYGSIKQENFGGPIQTPTNSGKDSSTENAGRRRRRRRERIIEVPNRDFQMQETVEMNQFPSMIVRRLEMTRDHLRRLLQTNIFPAVVRISSQLRNQHHRRNQNPFNYQRTIPPPPPPPPPPEQTQNQPHVPFFSGFPLQREHPISRISNFIGNSILNPLNIDEGNQQVPIGTSPLNPLVLDDDDDEDDSSESEEEEEEDMDLEDLLDSPPILDDDSEEEEDMEFEDLDGDDAQQQNSQSTTTSFRVIIDL